MQILQQKHHKIKSLDLKLPYISWNSEQSKVGIDFALGQSGKVSYKRINKPGDKQVPDKPENTGY